MRTATNPPADLSMQKSFHLVITNLNGSLELNTCLIMNAHLYGQLMMT